MARIVIVRGSDETDRPLRACLSDHHECYFVSDPAIVLMLLKQKKFDAIICSAHLTTGDVFAFIKSVKRDHQLKDIPLICMTTERSPLSSRLEKVAGSVALVVGADRFMSLDSYCDAKEHTSCKSCYAKCELGRLREVVERIIEDAPVSGPL